MNKLYHLSIDRRIDVLYVIEDFYRSIWVSDIRRILTHDRSQSIESFRPNNNVTQVY